MDSDAGRALSPPPAGGDRISEASGPADLAAFLRGLGARISPVLRGAPPPPADAAAIVRQVAADGDLVERFTKAATAAGLDVYPCGLDAWVETVLDVLGGCGAQTVYLDRATLGALPAGALDALAGALGGKHVKVQRTPDDATLFAVDAAITGVTAAIAETGTLVCTSGPQQARGASLIPPVHVAVVRAEQLLPDLWDYFATLSPSGEDSTRPAPAVPPGTPAFRPLPANVNLISGPSKTADIEGILITGVHGPGQVHVILITS